MNQWMEIETNLRRAIRLATLVCLLAVATVALRAQTGAALEGTVSDPKGAGIPSAKVTLHSASGVTTATTSDAQGHFAFPNLAPGTYTLDAAAAEFGLGTKKVVVTADHADSGSLTLQVAGANDQITVEAQATRSVAAAYAPLDALLDERSARTEITSQYIQNFSSPLADYGEEVALAPGTFTLNGNGVGLGQSKTYFRGFPDGDYDIDFDGVPFYDTNSPTHHSWAFFPSQWIGGIDFDRSPGTASTIGPTPFGGSIHLLSKDLSPIQNLRASFSYGSFNTYLFDGEYDSGSLMNGKLKFFADVQRMQSDGFQTNNKQYRNAGSIRVHYDVTPTFSLDGFSGVVYLHANTPNFNATRCQMYGASTVNTNTTCLGGGVPLPYTGYGINFYLADNSDPVDYLDYQYNRYQVPTDFEYVSAKTKLPFGINFEFKPYTYDYDNAEVYSNAVPITESTTVAFNGNPVSTSWYGTSVVPCNGGGLTKSTTVNGTTFTAPIVLPCGVDKYNSYRKYGSLLMLSQTSKIGTIRGGLWYEWARTYRHQFPSDPLNNWQDAPLSNFNEYFWTNSYQPYIEYEAHPLKKLTLVLGTKYAAYTIDTKQYADNGKTIGNLGTGQYSVNPTTGVVTQIANTGNPQAFISNHGSYTAWLPSIDGNYRILDNWSAYAQLSTGTIVPPSSVFDFNQGITGHSLPPEVAPKQQRSTTYQGGTVLKLKKVTLDVDAYHIRFQNSYSSLTDPNTGEPVYYLQPASITKGLEGESNVYFGHGLSAYMNASWGKATYTGNIYQACTGTVATTGCSASSPILTESAPANLWVQQTPHDTEGFGVTYQKSGFDLGFVDKRVGTFYIDDGSYHNQHTIDPFNVSNVFLNYTIRKGSRLDQTKIRLSFNNVFNSSDITGISLKSAAVPAANIQANNTQYVDDFNTQGQAPINGADTLTTLPGRSITLSVTFGWTPGRR